MESKTQRSINETVLCGGGTLGVKNKECEMILYNGVNDHFKVNDHFLISFANIDKCGKEYLNKMNLYNAGTDFCANNNKEYEMNFYAAATLGDGKSSEPLERSVYSGLKNRLLSYADVDVVKGAFEFWLNPLLKEKKLFIDSGAFSANSRGKVIDINNYIKFIKQNINEITVYAGLDVIGDYKKTRTNVEEMERQGLRPLPTFHYGSPIDELKRMLEKYNYIAIGGLVPIIKRKDVINKFLDSVFSEMGKGKVIKLHGFGLTTQSLLEKYPFYSCDSTAAIMGGGMGRIVEFKNGKLTNTAWRKTEQTGKHIDLMDRMNKEGSAHLERRIHNIKEMIKFEKYITELWAKRGIVWNED